jgi:hypothetical protein
MAEMPGEVGRGNAARGRCNLCGRPSCDHAAAGVATAGPTIDNPVRRGNHVQVVLDQDNRIAGRHQPVQLSKSALLVLADGAPCPGETLTAAKCSSSSKCVAYGPEGFIA